MTLAIRKFLNAFFDFFFSSFVLLIHSCKTIYNIVFILQVILQETYTEKIREDTENTPVVHFYNRNRSPWQSFGQFISLSYQVIYSRVYSLVIVHLHWLFKTDWLLVFTRALPDLCCHVRFVFIKNEVASLLENRHFWSIYYYKCSNSGAWRRLPESCHVSIKISFKCTTIVWSVIRRVVISLTRACSSWM